MTPSIIQCSKLTRAYLIENGINWWETPPESPDLNLIENIWGSMKTFLRDKVKPTDMALLLDGINHFWKSLTPAVCRKYVNHLQKVVPKVMEDQVVTKLFQILSLST